MKVTEVVSVSPSRSLGVAACRVVMIVAGQLYHVRLHTNQEVCNQLFNVPLICRLQWTREGQYGEVIAFYGR